MVTLTYSYMYMKYSISICKMDTIIITQSIWIDLIIGSVEKKLIYLHLEAKQKTNRKLKKIPLLWVVTCQTSKQTKISSTFRNFYLFIFPWISFCFLFFHNSNLHIYELFTINHWFQTQSTTDDRILKSAQKKTPEKTPTQQ